MTDVIRVGSRGSRLALVQAEWVRERVARRHPGLRVEIEVLTTKGDKLLDAPLAKLGDKGLFTKELEVALLDGRIDLAVHSAKDMPTAVPDGLAIVAVTEREDARDVFVADPALLERHGADGFSLDDVPRGAKVGSSSLRRRAQLLALRPDLDVVALRGNVDTRVRAVTEGDLDAVVLARAGLARLDRLDVVTQEIEVDLMLPAPAQGALAVECRDDDVVVLEALRRLDDAPTRAAVTAERALLAELEAGCSAPVGAYATVTVSGPGEELLVHLTGTVVSLDGRTQVRNSVTGSAGDAEVVGRQLARDLLAAGAPGLRPVGGSAS